MIDTEKYVKVVTSGVSPKREVSAVEILNQDITVTENGVYTADVGYTGLGTVTVDVPTSATGSTSITENGTYDVTEYAQAVVSVPNGTTSLSVDINGTYTPSGTNIGFNEVTVSVPNGTETISITENGTYTPTSPNIGFSSVSVNVAGALSFGMTAAQWGGSGVDSSTGRIIYPGGTPNFTGVEELGANEFYYKFYKRTDITGNIIFDDLYTIGSLSLSEAFTQSGISGFEADQLSQIPSEGMRNMCGSCANLRRVSLGAVETVSSSGLRSAFSNSGLTALGLSSLYQIGYYGCAYMCSGCTGMTSFTFNELRLCESNCLENCFANTSLTTLSFPSLDSDSFGAYTNQFNGMLSGVTGCTVHFPSNLQSVIGSWSSVTGGFGGTNTTVLFDLPATE